MEHNRRSFYRVTPDPSEGLELAILHRLGEEIAREVVDLSIDGAGTRFPASTAPKLAVGDVVRLTLRSPELAQPVELEAALVNQHERKRYRHFNFRFRHRGRLTSGLPSPFYRLLNRRGAYRAPASGTADPVQVEIAVPTDQLPRVKGIARLDNISATGLGALVPRAVENALAGIESVALELRLPENARTLAFMARILNRAQHEDMMYYGIKFDADRTTDFLDKAEDIVAYVLGRTGSDLERPAAARH